MLLHVKTAVHVTNERYICTSHLLFILTASVHEAWALDPSKPTRETWFGVFSLFVPPGWLISVYRDRRYRYTYGTKATRRTAGKDTRGGCRECRRTVLMAQPLLTWRTSASRTRAGMNARLCSLTARRTRIRMGPGSIWMSMHRRGKKIYFSDPTVTKTPCRCQITACPLGSFAKTA